MCKLLISLSVQHPLNQVRYCLEHMASVITFQVFNEIRICCTDELIYCITLTDRSNEGQLDEVGEVHAEMFVLVKMMKLAQ